MKRLCKKLHSRSGASILLALLFFLLCMTVAASILTAAASNAGKIQSSYQEQQKYLALSSALRLAAGQLEQAAYEGAGYKLSNIMLTQDRICLRIVSDIRPQIGQVRTVYPNLEDVYLYLAE